MKELIEILEYRKKDEKIAIRDSKGKCLSYKELYESSIRVAKRLDGINASKTILVDTGNVVEYAIALFGIWSSGRTAVIVGEHFEDKEIIDMAKFCDSDTFIYSVKSKIQEINEIRNNIQLTIEKNSDMIQYITKSCDVCFIGTTSGTTANPKYIMLSTEGVIEEVINICKTIKYKNQLKELMLLPVSSISITIAQLLVCLYLGQELMLFADKFSITGVLQFIKKEKPNYLVCTNSILSLIVYSKKIKFEDLECVDYIAIGGEAADEKLMERLRETWSEINVMQAYGMTETSGVISWYSQNGDAPAKSVGAVMNNFQVRIVDGDSILREGYIGEIEVSGKSVMRGYYKNEEMTSEVLKNGWLKTGDIGYLDKDGFLYIKGRKKRIIIVSGKNVYAEEVEEILRRHKKVAMAKVYGKKDKWVGEQIIADIVSIDNDLSKEEIVEYCRKNMKPYMNPRKINIVNTLEINNSKKLKYAN